MYENALPRCPFCGDQALAGRWVNPVSKNIVAKVFCISHHCNANVICVDTNPEKARNKAIERWSKRVPQ